MLRLNGWLGWNEDNIVGLCDNDTNEYYDSFSCKSIPNLIEDHYGYIRITKGLGGHLTVIENCNMRVYYTDSECSLEEVEELTADIFNGGLISDIRLVGYSEWTITGYNLDEFSIGGHDLNKEFSNHIGQYCWIIIED